MKVLLMNAGVVAEIDDDDLALFSATRWTVAVRGSTKYLQGRVGGRRVYLHRILVDVPEGLVVDHIDGNGLNNRRSNLRAVTRQQNVWNKCRKPLGRQEGRYRVNIRAGGRRICLGLFDTQRTAMQARVYFEQIVRGEFAINDGVDLSGFDPIHLSPSARQFLSGLG